MVLSPDAFDLSRKLRERLRETNLDKESIQQKINLVNEMLQKMYAKKPKRSRDSKEQMEKQIEELERKRTNTSIPLAQEKKILRQIDVIQRQKKTLADAEEHEVTIQNLKNELNLQRDLLRTAIAAAAEIDAALAKVELAKRLGCATTDLQVCIVDCPPEKMGPVIGKNGATIKQLEDRTGVQVDVDKVGCKIHLQGSETALRAAVEELESITLAVEELVDLKQEIVSYLFANRMAVLNEIQSEHPGVYFDIDRDSTTMKLRGKPENLGPAQAKLLSLDVSSRTTDVTSREISLIVGKGGATINRLMNEYGVSINVSSAESISSSVEVVGLTSNLDAAFVEIESILFENEELEETILVQPLVRNNFLANNGAVMKELQAEIKTVIEPNGGSALILFEKISRDEGKSSSTMIVKANRTNLPIAKEAIQKKVSEVEANILTIHVDPDIIPAVLGKGGSVIASLRELGAEIFVDKSSGEVKIESSDEKSRKAVTEAIDKIVAENQLMKIEIVKTLIGQILGGEGKELRKKITEDIGAAFNINSTDTHVVFRGTEEQINAAAELVREFIANNYTEELEVASGDEILLIIGGNKSVLSSLEKTHNVRAHLRKATNMVSIRGSKDDVQAATKELKVFLNGGDGIVIYKLKVAEGICGMIIGKGGNNLTKLEEKYEGAKVNVSPSNGQVRIRGPEEAVDKCRAEILTTIATAKVTETVLISAEDYEVLSKPENIRRISNGMPVQTTLSESFVRFRGLASDVRFAKASLKELQTGTYETSIELDESQFAKVQAAVRDPSHFKRIRDVYATSLSVDKGSSAIVIAGKRGAVKKSKQEAFNFLNFLLPAEFDRFKVPKQLLKAMGDISQLADVAAKSSVSINVDWDLNCIQVRSPDAESVQKAMQLLQKRLEVVEKLHVVQRFDQEDVWLLSKIIGKGGTTIQKLQDETGCKINASKDDCTVSILGENEDSVVKAKATFNAFVEKLRRECVFIDLPEPAMSVFIGKGGSNIKQLAETNNVKIERVRKIPTRVQIQGDEASVLAAKISINSWLAAWESKNTGVSIPVQDSVIPAIIGKSGSVINQIQKELGCRVDIDRKASIVTVRGGTEDQRKEAIDRINLIVSEQRRMLEEKKEAEALLRAHASEEKAKLQVANGNSHSEPTQSVTREEAQPASADQRKDRSKEFASRPVGIADTTSNSKITTKPTKQESKSNRKSKAKPKPAPKQEVVPIKPQIEGTTAVKGLFNLLMSDEDSVGPDEIVEVPLPGENNDVGNGVDQNSDLPPVKSVYKSASGFSVRV